ncbi:muscle M-line assembly protein unc-89-like isoform X2 [Venturia canescens]|nr:muscle M-line assembly protein unc-89-like isoform X2 [Venturia canescens]
MKKSLECSPPTSARTLRTRRQLSKTISQDSDVEDSPQINKTQNTLAQNTPRSKAAKSRKKAKADVVVLDESSAQDIESSRTMKRGRRGKNNEGPIEQSILLDNSNVNDSQVEKVQATKSRKRTTKKEDSKSAEESGEARRGKRRNGMIRENVSVVGTDTEVLTNSETEEVPMSVEGAEVKHASDKTPDSRVPSISTPSSARSVAKRRGRPTNKTRLEDFTPESSPIAINLSPHRTTKTPRKSPMNFGSPKSHAEQPLRLTRTPRKLPVVVESPAGSEKSIDSSINGTSKESPNHTSPSNTNLVGGNSASKKKRTPKIKSPVKSPRKTPSKDLVVRKFSKSPKIVLATPKAKSQKKSPRVVASKAKKSPKLKSSAKSPIKLKNLKSPTEKSEDAIVDKIDSPASAKKEKRPASSKKSVTPSSALNLRGIESQSNKASPQTSKPSNSPKYVNPSGQTNLPIVVLNKMQDETVITPKKTRKSSSPKSNNASIDSSLKVTPIKTPSAEKRMSQGGESPRRPKSTVKKRTPITDSGTPLRPIESPRTSSGRISIVNSLGSEKNTPAETRITRNVGENNVRMLSSTPRERIRRSLNLSPSLGTSLTAIPDSPPINGRLVGSSTLITEGRANRSLNIEDISNPLISEDDDSISLIEASKKGEETCLDGTFEIAKKNVSNSDEAEEEKTADGTYELIEPKTPVLRRKAAKRSIAEIDTSTDERITKRACRVRFASPPPNLEENKPHETGRAKSATPGPRVSERRFTPGSGKVTVPRKIADRKRSNSLSDVSVLKTPIAASSKRRSNSTTGANVVPISKSAQLASVNRLSKPRLSIHQSNKKTESKTPLARKVPNFAQIHQKKFAQMESLVDAKRRVEKRHLAISTQIPTSLSKVNTATRSKPKMSPKSSTPSVPVNGAYNRYGFKLRKNEAIKIVSQKQQPVPKRETKQSENRSLLKGVRTNRRFDLIMKARNIN